MALSWDRNVISLDGATFTVDHPVHWAALVQGVVVVMFDIDARPGPAGVFENLIAVSPSGRLVWRARVPTNYTGDCYIEARVEQGQLIAFAWCGLRVRIDPASGDIVAQEFIR